jgi:hypothetical protein
LVADEADEPVPEAIPPELVWSVPALLVVELPPVSEGALEPFVSDVLVVESAPLAFVLEAPLLPAMVELGEPPAGPVEQERRMSAREPAVAPVTWCWN